MGRGTLRIYLGAAPGVGKTYAMLNEGRRRQARGEDVVVGFVESHGRQRTADQVGDLEVVPRAADRLPRRRLRGDGPRRAPRAPAAARARRRARAHQRPGLSQREALAGRRGAARRRHQRHLQPQHPAPRVAQRRRGGDHRGRAARDDPGRGRAPRRPAPARRPCRRDDPCAALARRHLSGRAHRRRAGQLLPRRQPGRAARAGAALDRRPGRGGPRGVPRAPRHLGHVGDARAGARGALRVGRRRPARASRGAHGAAPQRRPDRRARASADRPGVRSRPRLLEQQGRLVERLGGTYREVAGADIGETLVETRAGAQRHPDRPRRTRALRAGASSCHGFGRQDGHPPFGRGPRRPRDQPAGRRRRRRAAPRLRRPRALPRRRVALGFAARRYRGAAPDAGARARRATRCRRRARCCSSSCWSSACRRSAGSGRRWSRRSAASSWSTGSSRLRCTRGRWATRRTCSRSSSFWRSPWR